MQKKTKMAIIISVVALIVITCSAVMIYIGASNNYTQTYADFMAQYNKNSSEFDVEDYFDIEYYSPVVDSVEGDTQSVGSILYKVTLKNKTEKAVTIGVAMFAGNAYSVAGVPSLTENEVRTITIEPGSSVLLSALGKTDSCTTKPQMANITDDAAYTEIAIEMHMSNKRAFIKLTPNVDE